MHTKDAVDALNLPPRITGFIRGYLDAMFFTDGAEMEGGVTELAPSTVQNITADCTAFFDKFSGAFEWREEEAGRDFWYTRSRCGVGFYDGDWDNDNDTALAQTLTQAALGYRELSLCTGDDGLLYLE